MIKIVGPKIDFELVVRLGLTYNQPPPLSAKDLCDYKTWEGLSNDARENVERIFNKILLETHTEH